MFSRFWIRLGKFGLFTLIAYLLMAWIVIVTIIIREELAIVDATKVISVFNPAQGSSTIEG